MNNRIRPTGEMSVAVAELIGKFGDIDLNEVCIVEPPSLAPLCAAGDFLNISGPAGFGKTTLGVDLLVGAFHPDRKGTSLGGLFQFHPSDPRPIKSAIIDSESTRARWNSAIRRRLHCEGLNPSINHYIRHIPASDLSLNSPCEREAKARLAAEALAYDSREFVLIDTLAMAWKPANMNDPEWVFAGLAPFHEACQKYGITVVALTHTPRPGQPGARSIGPIGTSFQENQADAQLVVSRLPKGQPKGIRLTHRKSRRSFWIQQETHVDLRFDGKLGYDPVGNWATEWPMEWPEQLNLEPQSISQRYRIECAVRDAGPKGIAATSVASNLDMRDRSVRNHLRNLADSDILEIVGRGRNSRWRSCR